MILLQLELQLRSVITCRQFGVCLQRQSMVQKGFLCTECNTNGLGANWIKMCREASRSAECSTRGCAIRAPCERQKAEGGAWPHTHTSKLPHAMKSRPMDQEHTLMAVICICALLQDEHMSRSGNANSPVAISSVPSWSQIV